MGNHISGRSSQSVSHSHNNGRPACRPDAKKATHHSAGSALPRRTTGRIQIRNTRAGSETASPACAPAAPSSAFPVTVRLKSSGSRSLTPAADRLYGPPGDCLRPHAPAEKAAGKCRPSPVNKPPTTALPSRVQAARPRAPLSFVPPPSHDSVEQSHFYRKAHAPHQ